MFFDTNLISLQKSIASKQYIQKLKHYFAQKELITTSDVVDYFALNQPDISRATVNWRVHELVRTGVLERIGRGRFRLGKTRIYHPDLSQHLGGIFKQIQEKLPYGKTCIWSLGWVNEFTQHVFSTSLCVVEAERDMTEAVYHLLKEKSPHVFYDIDASFINEYVLKQDKPILVRKLITDAPVQRIDDITVPTLEKILVDIASDKEFGFLYGNELNTVFQNAFGRYTINISKQLRYAERKGKKAMIQSLIPKS
jgi:DNA-binding Lrp family transcriptional regulator